MVFFTQVFKQTAKFHKRTKSTSADLGKLAELSILHIRFKKVKF